MMATTYILYVYNPEVSTKFMAFNIETGKTTTKAKATKFETWEELEKAKAELKEKNQNWYFKAKAIKVEKEVKVKPTEVVKVIETVGTSKHYIEEYKTTTMEEIKYNLKHNVVSIHK